MAHPVLPSRDDLVRLNSVEGAHRVGLRAALSVLVPLLAVVALGRPELAPYASFGAFTSLYGRNLRHLTRVQMQLSAAATMTLAVCTGVVVGCYPHLVWLHILTAGVIAFTGQVLARAHSFHPPGPLFMIFGYGAISSMPHTWQDLPLALLVCGLSALFSCLVGVAGVLVGPESLGQAWRRTGWLKLQFVHSWQPVWMALGVLLSGSIAQLAGIGHPYWAMVAALAPLSAPHITSQMTRAIHRSIGTLVGLVGAGLLLALHLPPVLLVVVIAVLQLLTEMWVGRNYAVAMVFITPLALGMGQVGGAHPIGPLLFDRGVETLVGSVVGIGVALAGHELRRRRLLRHAPLG
ncbi:FUSC family protein [Luteococcus peritonei]|uniref:FUSC family protein n=1 Tax=Luteococcus peritonei TaxID=88874 RepID=A0ABW4RZ30_9ACTN